MAAGEATVSERILIIRLGALGDVANVMPAVAGLRRARPDDHLAWLVEGGPAGLVEIDRDVDEVIVFPRRRLSRALRRPWLWPWVVREVWRFLRDLRLRGFDRVLDFQGHLKSGMLSHATRCPWRAGFAKGHGKEGNHYFQTVHVEPPDHPVSRRERALRLVRALAPEVTPLPPNLRVGVENMQAVHAFLNGLGDGPKVVLHPGASRFGSFKRWPAERFGQVAMTLAEELDAVVIVTHGPAEDPATVQTALSSAQGRAVLAPDLNLPQLTGLLRGADLFIGADSGPLHIAALAGTPCVAIFGPKDPVVYAPRSARIVRRADLDCSPCNRRSCRDLRCILDITVEQVLEAALESLDTCK